MAMTNNTIPLGPIEENIGALGNARRKYANDAERQRAHRARVKERLAGLPSPPPPKRSRKTTRPQRIDRIAEELLALIDEYRHWLDSLPENLAQGEMAERLQETIGHLEAALEAVETVDPPLGFGR